MRFSIASIALLAGLVASSSLSTVYTTEDVTITSCAPTVTNCPGRTSVPAVAPTSVVVPPAVSVSSAPYPTGPAPSISVITLTTCVPTTSLSTITLKPTAAPTIASSPVVPSGTGVPHSTTPSSPIFTGAASSFSGSFALAGAAAAAAVFLA